MSRKFLRRLDIHLNSRMLSCAVLSVDLHYLQVSLASDFMYNHMSKDVTASFGYDYLLRQCRLRGKIDSNGVVAAYLEERLNMGVNFLLSAEIDHCKKNYKFGFGMTVGE